MRTFRTVSRVDRSAAPSTDSARADVVKPCSVQVRRPACSETAVHPLDASHALAHHSARPGRPCTYDTAEYSQRVHCAPMPLHRDRARAAAKVRRGTMSTHSRNRECSQWVLSVLTVHAEIGPATALRRLSCTLPHSFLGGEGGGEGGGGAEGGSERWNYPNGTRPPFCAAKVGTLSTLSGHF